jgi:hypothetical protein
MACHTESMACMLVHKRVTLKSVEIHLPKPIRVPSEPHLRSSSILSTDAINFFGYAESPFQESTSRYESETRNTTKCSLMIFCLNGYGHSP